jgi:hypothetical protein
MKNNVIITLFPQANFKQIITQILTLSYSSVRKFEAVHKLEQQTHLLNSTKLRVDQDMERQISGSLNKRNLDTKGDILSAQ